MFLLFLAVLRCVRHWRYVLLSRHLLRATYFTSKMTCFFLKRVGTGRVFARKSNLMLPSDSGGVWLSFFFFCFLRTPDTSSVPTEAREHEAREPGNFSAPRLWLKCWVLLPVAARGGGRPSPQAAWGGRTVSHPPAPPTNNFETPPASTRKERTGPRTLAARKRRVSRRAPGASCGALPARVAARNRRVLWRASGAFCGAQPARVAARKRRVVRRAPGAYSGAQPVRLATRTRRVFRRAPSASCGAQSARFCGVRSFCILNWFVLILVLLL